MIEHNHKHMGRVVDPNRLRDTSVSNALVLARIGAVPRDHFVSSETHAGCVARPGIFDQGVSCISIRRRIGDGFGIAPMADFAAAILPGFLRPLSRGGSERCGGALRRRLLPWP
jgi:hypothetical protein